ncbi:MAG: hypothetical protein SAJ72_07835 [Jaaginema sp. PMC 1080.18]|nr:hypothetical protein [Jaaginema sp. PMC 1080.18]MEC4865044.1 hypothetical protein [Jaaginema sp. PMC 1078.18]
MSYNFNFILKVAIASALLAVIVKYGGPLLPIRPTPTNALIAVLSPTLITAGILLGRWWKTQQKSSISNP